MRATGIDVVVPSHRRPLALSECLAGLAAQSLPPARVIVVARPDDPPTWDASSDAGRDVPLEIVPVTEPGLVAALRAGVAATRAPRVAFTDDDAVPLPGWLGGLAALLDEPGVGVAGGRDLIPGQLEPRRSDVGRLTRWGRFSGNHHLGRGPARDVHVVKGVNMAYRSEALAVPRAGILLGRGAEVHSEELMCAWARARGWRVRYDPAVTLRHRERADEAIDGVPDRAREVERWYADAHNRMLGTLATDPRRASVHVAYALLFGSREAPGVGRVLLGAATGDRAVVERTRASFAGQTSGVRDRTRLSKAMVSCAELRRGA